MGRRNLYKTNLGVIGNVPFIGLRLSDVIGFIFLFAIFANWPKSHKDLSQRIMIYFWLETQYQTGNMNQPLVGKESFLLPGCERYLTHKANLQV